MRRLAFQFLVLVTFVLSQIVMGCAGCDGGDTPITPDTTTVDAGDGGVEPDTGIEPDTKLDQETADAEAPPTPALGCVVKLGAEAIAFSELNSPLTLSAEDETEAYKPSPDFQLTFQVVPTAVPDGTEVSLKLGDGPAQTATIATSNHLAEFEGVTMPYGTTAVTVSAEVGGETVSCEVVEFVLDEVPPCDVILAPAAGCLTVDAAGDAGTQLAFTVQNPDGRCTSAQLFYTIDGGATLVSDPVALAGSAAVTITLAGSDGVALQVRAQVKGPMDAMSAESDPIDYTVDTEGPVVSVAPLAAVNGLSADAEPDVPGVQLNIAGTVAEGTVLPEDAVSCSAGDQAVLVSVDADGNFKCQLSFTESWTGTVNVAAHDGCGNISSAEPQTISVFTVPTALAFVLDGLPAQPWKGADDDVCESTTTFETSLLVAVSSVEAGDGADLTVSCTNGVATLEASVAPVTVTAPGDYQVPVSIDVGSLGQELSCVASVGAINPGQSAALAVKIGLPAPWVAVSVPAPPAEGEAAVPLLTRTKTPMISGQSAFMDSSYFGTASATLSVSAVGGGEPAYTRDIPWGVFQSGAFSMTAALTTDGNLDSPALPDGTYAVRLAGTDLSGNDICAFSCFSNCDATITLDTQAPAVTLSPLGPLDSVAIADEDPVTPGYQTTFTVTTSDLTDTVCLTVAGQESCQSGDTALSFVGSTLQSGLNAVTVTSTDLAGNVATVVSDIELISDAPGVTIVIPAKDTSTAAQTVTVVAEVLPGADNQAVVGAKVQVNGVVSQVAGVESPAGTWTFAGVALSIDPAANSVVVTATSAIGAQGASAPRAVLYKPQDPIITMASPTDQAVFNLASSECSGAGAGCVTAVTCDTQFADDSSAATLLAACGGAPITAQGVVSGGSVTFDAVSLPNNVTCTLTCTVTDDGTGKIATSSAVTVRIDRTAPAFGVFVKPATESLIFTDDEEPETPKLQLSVKATVAGLEVGQVVTLTTTGSPDAPAPLTHTVTQNIADGALTTVTFPKATYPDGSLTFTVTTSDKAGNPAQALSKTVKITVDEPLVRISGPAAVPATACTQDSDCTSGGACIFGTCGTRLGASSSTQFIVISKAIPTPGAPGTLRFCTNSLDFAAEPACPASGAGFHVMTTTSLGGSPTTVDLGAFLTPGIHMITAEARLSADGVLWKSSMEAPQVDDRQRLIEYDNQLPTVTALASDTDTDGSGCINIVEANGGVDVQVTCDETGSATLSLNGQEVATESVTADQVATFASVSLAEGDNTLSARCRDAFANFSAVQEKAVSLDTAAPTLSFAKPLSSPILVGGDRDVAVSSDADGQQVALTRAPAGGGQSVDVGTAAVANGQALFDHASFGALPDGQWALQASVSDACGNPSAASSPDLVVDTAAPTVALDTPAAAATFVDADDADAAGGFQIATVLSTTGDASQWELRLESGCDDAFSGCHPTVVAASGAITAIDSAEPAVLLTLPIFKTPDYLRVTAWTRDAAGNEISVTHNITVTLSNCSMAFSGLPANGNINNGSCLTAGQDCESVDQSFKVTLVGACGAIANVTLREDGQDVDTQPVAASEAAFVRNLAHGAAVSWEAVAASDAGISTGALALQVDLKAPVVAFTSPATSPQSYNLADDLSAGAPGLQITMALQVQDQGFGGGSVLSFDCAGAPVTSAPALPTAIIGTDFGLAFDSVSLADGADLTCEVTVQDSVGNVGTTALTYSSDVIPPATPALAITDSKRRRPAVTLGWSAVGDNASAGAAAETYDIRFSKAAITTAAEFDAACDATALLTAAGLPAPAAPGTAESYVVTGPDARGDAGACRFLPNAAGPDGAPTGSYTFAVRVQDAAGNWSDVASVSTSALGFRAAKVSVPTTSSNFSMLAQPIGDINNDGAADFTFGGAFSHGFCIVFGVSGEIVPDFGVLDATNPPAGARCFLEASSKLGYTASPAGDVNGDGLMDFAVAAGGSGTAIPRQVRIYAGVTAGNEDSITAPILTIINAGTESVGAHFAAGGDFDGDGFTDIIIGDRKAELGWIIPGSNQWAADAVLDLAAPAAAFDVQTLTPAATANADFWAGGVSTADFGDSLAFLGDIIPDADGVARDEVAIGLGSATALSVIVFKGRDITGPATLSVKMDTGGDGNVRLLASGDNTKDFGETLGAADVDGDGINDVLVGHHKNAGLDGFRLTNYVFYGAAIAASAGDTGMLSLGIQPTDAPVGDGFTWLSAAGRASYHVSALYHFAGNLLDDPTQGVDASAIVSNSKSYNTSVDDPRLVYLRFNTDAGGALGYGTYPQVDMTLTDPFGNGGLWAYQNVVGVGDVNADGIDDLLVATLGAGYVVIFY